MQAQHVSVCAVPSLDGCRSKETRSTQARVRSKLALREREAFKRICREIDSPRSLACYMLIEAGQYEDYLELTIRPDSYESAFSFADDYLVTECLRKSTVQKTSVDLEATAFAKWIDAENRCRVSNERLESTLLSGIFPEGRIGEILRFAAQVCQLVLGPLTRRTLDQVDQACDFGPGATTAVGGAITRGRKFSSRILTTTPALVDYGLFCLPDLWRPEVQGFKLQDCNKLTFVPKNAKTHRAITIENDLNIFVQKGIGRVLRQKLRNFGIDLDYQWQKHHRFVRDAWKRDTATIDLSSASDTVSFNCVRYFLPDDWFELLCWARPQYSVYKKLPPFMLEKFSGMGNGYTFELETLIFYSVLESARVISGCDHEVSVFGDDMICSNDIRQDVIDALEFLGFSVNREKTFGNGPFHESCGCDYFQDTPVRPFYFRIKDPDSEESIATYQYCNKIRVYAHNRTSNMGCDARFLPAWLYCYTSLPRRHRLFVPSEEFADCGVIGNFDEATPALKQHEDWIRGARRRGLSGYRFTTLKCPAVLTQQYPAGAYISAVKSGESESFTYGSEAIRNRKRGSQLRTAYALAWPGLGPWV